MTLLNQYVIPLLTFMQLIASNCVCNELNPFYTIYKDSFLTPVRPYGDVIVFYENNSENWDETIAGAVNEISSLSPVALLKLSQFSGNFEDTVVYLFPLDKESLLRIFEQIHLAFERKFALNLYWRPVFIILWPTNLNFLNEQEIFKNITFTMDTDIYIAYPPNNSSWDKNFLPSDFLLAGIYSIKNIPMMEHFQLDTDTTNGQDMICSVGESTKMYPMLRKVFRRQDFMGAPIIAIEILADTPDLGRHIHVDNVTNVTTFIGGYDVIQFWFLRDSLNFRGIEAKAIGWISSSIDGSPTGMNAQIINGDADLSIASSAPYDDKKIFFLQPIHTTGLYVFFVQPARESFLYTHTRPFTLMAWICMFLIFMSAALCIVAFVKVKKLFGEVVSDNDKNLSKGAIFWALFLIASKGWNRPPDSTSLKGVMLAGLMLTSVIYTEYTSNLITFFSIEILPIHDFSDIVNTKFTIYASGYRDSARFALGENKRSKISKVRSEDSAISVSKVLNSRSAFVGITDELYVLVEHNKTIRQNAQLMSTFLVSPVRTKAGAFVKRGSPFEEFFNYKIINLFENGIRYRLLQKSRQLAADISSYNAMRDMHQITVVDSTVPFVIISVGHLFSFIFCILEKFTSTKSTETNH